MVVVIIHVVVDALSMLVVSHPGGGSGCGHAFNNIDSGCRCCCCCPDSGSGIIVVSCCVMDWFSFSYLISS